MAVSHACAGLFDLTGNQNPLSFLGWPCRTFCFRSFFGTARRDLRRGYREDAFSDDRSEALKDEPEVTAEVVLDDGPLSANFLFLRRCVISQIRVGLDTDHEI